MSITIWRRTALAAAILCASAAPAAAQQEEPVSRTIPGWTFTPGFILGGVYDSNVGLADAPASTGTTESDQLYVVAPFGRLDFQAPRTHFSSGYHGTLRRYADVRQLNGFDQRVDMSLRRLATRRLTFFLSDAFMHVPTTDEVELNGVPFSRTGTRTNNVEAGFTARLTQFTEWSTRYENVWVQFDRRPDAAAVVLTGGVVNGLRTDLSHRLNERLSLGAEYGIRLADLNQGTRALTFHDAGGTLKYVLGPGTRFYTAAGVSHLADHSIGLTRTGPYVRVGLSHAVVRATVGVGYERSFVPSFGFGGSNKSQELRGYVQMPISRSRLYVQGSAAWRRTDPFLEGELQLDTIWIRSTVGYSAARWLRLEGFHAYTRQDSIVVGGEIDRQRAGFQAVISQPMRIR
jgi:hypothetical protein